jgi:hypothetical protein
VEDDGVKARGSSWLADMKMILDAHPDNCIFHILWNAKTHGSYHVIVDTTKSPAVTMTPLDDRYLPTWSEFIKQVVKLSPAQRYAVWYSGHAIVRASFTSLSSIFYSFSGSSFACFAALYSFVNIL